MRSLSLGNFLFKKQIFKHHVTAATKRTLHLTISHFSPSKADVTSTKLGLFSSLAEKQPTNTTRKVTIVGVGKVGMACAICLLTQKISSNICLIDANEESIKGEAMDLLHGSVYIHNPKVIAGTDYEITANSRICIIAAGIRPKGRQTRLDVMHANVVNLLEIVPKLLKFSPNVVFVITTNPVDVLVWVTLKHTGMPAHRVIGTGCSLETARFRYMVGERLGISASSVHGYVIGEHGLSCVPVWSGLNVAGVRFRDINPNAGLDNDPDKWNEINTEIVTAAYNVRSKKGCTNWAIALATGQIIRSILTNAMDAQSVTVPVKGFHGVEEDVCISLPAVIGHMGITDIANIVLTPYETEMFQKSARAIDAAQKSLKF